MIHFNINRIDVKKTKVTAVSEINTGLNKSKEDAFLDLLLIGILAGSSANCIRQIAKERLSKEVVDFEKVAKLQDEFDNLLYKMRAAVKIDQLNVPTDKHIFY